MYRAALRTSDGASHFLLHSGRYPLTGQGDVNTYSVFAETFRTIAAQAGTAGIITPTGLATDKTTAPFFADTLNSNRLIAFYDFENEAKIFPGVHQRLSVCSNRYGWPSQIHRHGHGSPSSVAMWPMSQTADSNSPLRKYSH